MRRRLSSRLLRSFRGIGVLRGGFVIGLYWRGTCGWGEREIVTRKRGFLNNNNNNKKNNIYFYTHHFLKNVFLIIKKKNVYIYFLFLNPFLFFSISSLLSLHNKNKNKIKIKKHKTPLSLLKKILNPLNLPENDMSIIPKVNDFLLIKLLHPANHPHAPHDHNKTQRRQEQAGGGERREDRGEGRAEVLRAWGCGGA